MALYNCLQKSGLRRRRHKMQYAEGKTRLEARKPLAATGLLLVYLSRKIWSVLLFLVCVLAELARLLPLWIYELFRFCPSKKVGPVADFLVIGHRGAAAHAPENTIASCRHALEVSRADGVEIDICLTADGQLVLWHDPDPDDVTALVRQMGLEPYVRYRPFVPQDSSWRRPVHRLTLAELREHYGYSLRKKKIRKISEPIPTLDEFFQWTAGQSGLRIVLLDIKVDEHDSVLCSAFADELRKLLLRHQPGFKIVLLSPQEGVLDFFKPLQSLADLSLDVILPLVVTIDPQEFSAVDRARQMGNRCASVGRPLSLGLAPWTTYRRVVAYDMRQLSQNGQDVPDKLIGWTINRRREMKCLMKMGVSGLLSDYPLRLGRLAEKLQTQPGQKIV